MLHPSSPGTMSIKGLLPRRMTLPRAMPSWSTQHIWTTTAWSSTTGGWTRSRTQLRFAYAGVHPHLTLDEPSDGGVQTPTATTMHCLCVAKKQSNGLAVCLSCGSVRCSP